MRRALVVALLAVCPLLLGSCGGDRFAGSWAAVGPKDDARDIVIAKTSEGYQMAFVDGGHSSGWLRLKESGDTLKGAWHSHATATEPALTTSLSLTYDDGVLIYRESTFGDEPMGRFTKVSDRTTAPSPKATAQ